MPTRRISLSREGSSLGRVRSVCVCVCVCVCDREGRGERKKSVCVLF